MNCQSDLLLKQVKLIAKVRFFKKFFIYFMVKEKEESNMKKLVLIAAMAALSLNLALWGQSITVTSPTAASSWCKGNTYSITWTKSGSMQATAAIRLRAAGSSESDPATLAIADGTANNGSYSWTIPGTVAPGNYFIRVRTDDSTVSDDSPNFEIKACATGPSITVTKPHGGTWFKKMKYDITWDKTGIMPDHVKISLRNAFWMPGHPAVDILVIAADTPNDGSFSWIIPNSVANGTYVIRVTTIGPDPDISDTSTSFKIAPGFILPPHEWVVREPWFHFPDPDPCLCPEFNIREFLEDIIHGVGPQFDGSIFLLKNGLKLQELGAFGEGKVLPDKVKAKLSPENFAALKNHTAKFSLGVFDANGQLVKEVEVQGAQQAELR